MKRQGRKVPPKTPNFSKTGFRLLMGKKLHATQKKKKISKMLSMGKKYFIMAFGKFKDDMTNMIMILMKQIIKSREHTNKNVVELKKEKENMNIWHRKE